MIRLFFLIRSLGRGGAERQLVELAKGLDKTCFAITIATYYDGVLRPELESIPGIQVIPLHKRRRWDLLAFFWRLWWALCRAKPHILHGYNMGMANELCLLFGRLVGTRVVWGLRASNRDFSHYDWLFSLGFRLGAWLSRFADLIITNSHAGKQYHLTHGYCKERMVVIPNGIDAERFHPDRKAGRRVRAEWGINDDECLIGLVGRFHPMKDHPNFLKAATCLTRQRDDVRFVCVGDGPESYKSVVIELAEQLGLAKRLIWAGERSDMPAVYNALDIATSASAYGEGFSNVVGEAMACGVPCVVTDVGDLAWIVGEAGRVVPPGDPEALASGWAEISALPKPELEALSQMARDRIVTEFTCERLIERTEAAFQTVVRSD